MTSGGSNNGRPSQAQARYLRLGLNQPGGKLPLFDPRGQRINPATIRSCIEHGWAEPWFENPVKPDWLVCRLTEQGRQSLERSGEGAARDGPDGKIVTFLKK